MPILRLAYTTQFLIALIAVFFLWSEIGGQGHLDLMPWYLKLVLGAGVAYAAVRATAASVAQEPAWNIKTLKWFGAMLALLVACALVTYYYHLYGEDDQDEPNSSIANAIAPQFVGRTPWSARVPLDPLFAQPNHPRDAVMQSARS